MAFSTTSLSEEIAYILMNIEQYEFEDVKQIQVIFTELHNNFTDLVDEAFYPKRNEIVRCLIEKYQSPVLTFECPELKTHRESLKDIWNENEKGLKDFFSSELIFPLTTLEDLVTLFDMSVLPKSPL
jgi:hypothetical protein